MRGLPLAELVGELGLAWPRKAAVFSRVMSPAVWKRSLENQSPANGSTILVASWQWVWRASVNRAWSATVRNRLPGPVWSGSALLRK